MKRLPVYKLEKGQSFKYTDNRWWIVDEVILPDKCLGQINTPPLNAEILAHYGQTNRRFYMHQCKVLEVKE